MKGMMVQDNATLDDALRIMEEGQMPDSQAPTLPPRVIGKYIHVTRDLNWVQLLLSAVVSSSSGTDNQDFNYTSSSEVDMVCGN